MESVQYARLVSDEFVRAGYRHFCGHDAAADVDDAVLAEYRQVLDEAVDERPLQEFLERHPALLTGELNMYCRWVLPQVALGGAYIPDFLTTRLDSGGLSWTLVELESPRAQLFTRDGTPASKRTSD